MDSRPQSHDLRDVRHWLLFALVVSVPTAALFVDPVAQDPAYHVFADRRTLFGIANFWNVASNVPFILVGALGVIVLADPAAVAGLPELRVVYRFLFASLILTGLGSAWYHLAPANATLVWDRFGITLSIAALFSAVFGEHASPQWARRLFLPLLLIGIGSVAWWAYSESRGTGDLRAYAIFQFMPMVLMPLILVLYPSPFDRSGFIWWVIALYAVARLCEFLDQPVFATTGFISGHSLKHMVAAAAMAVFLRGLMSRRLRD